MERGAWARCLCSSETCPLHLLLVNPWITYLHVCLSFPSHNTVMHTMSLIINCCVSMVWMEAYFSARGMETRGIESPFAGIIS